MMMVVLPTMPLCNAVAAFVFAPHTTHQWWPPLSVPCSTQVVAACIVPVGSNAATCSFHSVVFSRLVGVWAVTAAAFQMHVT
jgi:hypothetical protein